MLLLLWRMLGLVECPTWTCTCFHATGVEILKAKS